MLRNLLYFWRINLAVVLGAAVATAVLTGALLVGDSVRGSLRDLTLDRLGNVDEALVTDQFFRQKLAGDLRNNSLFKEGFSDAVPAILLTGSITNAESKTRASKVNIMGTMISLCRSFRKSRVPAISRKISRSSQGRFFKRL